jgi:L-ascorbate metabolism protein UlaG (beta-lactamase superfamily)
MLEFGAAEGGVRLRIYITGDTLVHKRLREIPERYPDIDLGLFHLGGTRIFGLYVTMTGKQGAEAIKITNPKTALPIHYDDYEVMKSPLSDFRQAVAEAGLEDRVSYLVRGEDFEFEVPEGRS